MSGRLPPPLPTQRPSAFAELRETASHVAEVVKGVSHVVDVIDKRLGGMLSGRSALPASPPPLPTEFACTAPTFFEMPFGFPNFDPFTSADSFDPTAMGGFASLGDFVGYDNGWM